MKTRQKQQPRSVVNLFRMALHGNAFSIYKHKDFHALLERERALADRHNRLFSLVEFNMTDTRPTPTESQVLLDVLSNRLRKSDIAGWIAPFRVGVILPDTPSCGAWVLTERVCQEVSGQMARPVCKVCTYPAEENQPVGPVNAKAALPTAPARETAPPTVGAQPDLVSGILFGRPPLWKRALDILGGGTAMVLLSPVMMVVALMIKMVSKGPVLFRQERVGYLGRPFVCWKFRTMRVNADIQVHKAHFQNLMKTDVPMTKLDLKDDPRLIPLGKYLRASGVDELPQLFNVLRGDMSLVGPRPSIRYEYDGYQRWQKNRCDTLPGLTGLWQISGKNKTTFTEMMRLDISYARRKSLAVDLLMLVKTVPAVLGEVRTTMRVNRRRSCKTFSTSES
jgi:lipopolysaccharide/colanic/teichoic acid biosynthesis glycosyltransferase